MIVNRDGKVAAAIDLFTKHAQDRGWTYEAAVFLIEGICENAVCSEPRKVADIIKYVTDQTSQSGCNASVVRNVVSVSKKIADKIEDKVGLQGIKTALSMGFDERWYGVAFGDMFGNTFSALEKSAKDGTGKRSDVENVLASIKTYSQRGKMTAAEWETVRIEVTKVLNTMVKKETERAESAALIGEMVDA